MTNVIQADEETPRNRVIPVMSPEQAQTGRTVDRDSVLYAAATGVSLEDTRAQVEAGVTAGLEGQALSERYAGTQRAVEEALNYDENLDDVIFGMIEDGRAIESISRFLPNSLEAAIRNNLPGARDFALDRLTRLNLTAERIAEKTEGMSGVGSIVVDFAEAMVDPLSLLHSATYRRLTREYEALLQPTVSMEEFNTGLDRILTDAADAGFLSDENLFFFGDFLDTLGSGVFSGTQNLQETLGVLDLGLTGAFEVAPAAIRGTRAIRTAGSLAGATALSTGVVSRGALGAVRDAARDTLGAIGIMRPSARMDQVAADTLSHHITMDDPTRASTDASAHSHMSYATPTLARGALMSAATARAARQFEENSIILDRVMDVVHRTGRVFDQATIDAFTTQFRSDRMRLLSESGMRGVIDVEVGVDEFNNIFSVDVIGRVNGDYFATATTAARAASFGDEVVQVAPNQFAVVRRNNISANNLETARELGYTGDLRGLMLYRATDPEQLGDGFWAHWGSPLAQGDPEMTPYLFRSSTVYQDALHQMRVETKRVTRGMPSRHIVEVYNAFEAMARSARRDAFTAQEFTSWFNSEFHRAPTSQQVNLYLLQQERLDAELFITANELYRSAVDRGFQVLRSGEIDYLVRPVSPEGLESTIRVYDEATGANIPLRELGERQLYRNVGDSELPTNVQYFTSETPQVRAVRHSDFMARNAGGHRAYIVNQMQYLVKQRGVRTYSDGSERDIAPRTLLGTRTPEDARKAMDEVNVIIDTIREQMGTAFNRGMRFDEFTNALTAFRNNRVIREVIQANNGWNPRITNLDELASYAADRGLDLRRRFEVVGEGQPMSRYLNDTADIDNYAFALRNASHGDDVRMNALRGGRGSIPLSNYGGDPIATRLTQDVLEGSYASSLARATETAFRLRTFNGWVRAATESGVLKVDYVELAKLPIRTQIERILRDDLIDTTGAKGARANIGPRLKLDLQRLQFRLQQQSFTTRIFQNAYRRAANFLYGKNFTWAADKVDRFSRDPLSALRGWAFDTYLGMFNISQYLMQGSQIINIMGIAGVNGIKGAALYPAFRFLLNNQHPEVIERVAKLTSKITGLDVDDWNNMIRMFSESGRRIVDNNLAELTMAEDAMSNFGRAGVSKAVRNFREVGRTPYKEGELSARISAFVTSYIEYTAKHGKITNIRDQRAVNFITKREQVLTQAMGAESRQAYEQLPFMQFMTYNLRITEALMAGTFGNTKSVLTTAEKVRLASTHFAFWGAAASAPTAWLVQHLSSNYETDVDENIVRAFRSGALDALVSWVTGSDTAISSRFASGTGWAEQVRALSEEGFLTTVIGPSGQLALETGRVTLSTIYHGINGAVTGNFTPAQDDLIALARFTSSGNYTFNAYTAFRYGEYLSRRSSLVTEDLSQIDAMFLMFGIPLEEVQSMYQYQGDRRFRTRWLEATVVPSLNRLYEQMWTAARRDDLERVRSYFGQIGVIENSLDPWERNIVDARVNPDFRSATNSLMLELQAREVEAQELVR